MGKKRRNNNKADRDDYAFAPMRQQSSQQSSRFDVNLEDDEESFASNSCDEDLQSVVSDFGYDGTGNVMNRMDEYIDHTLDKRDSVRILGLNCLIGLLRKEYIGMDLLKWKSTIIDVIDKFLKKGGDEGVRAANLAALFSLQLGNELKDEIEELLSFMRKICADSSQYGLLRLQCIISLTICTIFSTAELQSINESLTILRNLWINTKTNAPLIALFCTAIENWILLVAFNWHISLQSALLDQPKLSSFIDGSQARMRISAGEVLAVLHEMAVSHFGTEYRFANQQNLLEKFATLSTSSAKYIGKKDRRTQKFSFRQLYNYIEEQEAPSFTIKFGKEALNLDSCKKKLLYDICCGILCEGMNAHLKSNPFLRESFDLEAIQINVSLRLTKTERMAAYKTSNKLRSMQRQKKRDKRISINDTG